MNEIILHVTSSLMAGHFLVGLAVLIISLIEYGMPDDSDEFGEFKKLTFRVKILTCVIIVLGGYISLWEFIKHFNKKGK